MKDAGSDSISRPELRKALGLRNLVLLNVSCVVGLYMLAQAAQFGWSSIPIWIVGILSLLPNSKRFNGGGLECQKKVVFTYGRKGRLVNGMVSWLPGHIG